MNYWFLSDTHFGHKNIIKYCNRPFSSTKEMDEALISIWNERVKPEDRVYFLGDFAFADPRPYLDRLHGKKWMLWGNHDNSTNQKLIKNHYSVEWTGDYLELGFFSKFIVLNHYKYEVFNKSHHGALNFYGHSHDTVAGNSQQTDVGVDVPFTNYGPVSYEEIEAHLKTLPPFVMKDHHGPATNP